MKDIHSPEPLLVDRGIDVSVATTQIKDSTKRIKRYSKASGADSVVNKLLKYGG